MKVEFGVQGLGIWAVRVCGSIKLLFVQVQESFGVSFEEFLLQLLNHFKLQGLEDSGFQGRGLNRVLFRVEGLGVPVSGVLGFPIDVL